MKLLNNNMVLAAFALLAIVAVSACFSGGGNGSGTPVETSGVSQGVVTAKGSIFVNGIEYSTTNAAITIDDTPAVENDLKAGMTVKVQGGSNDSTRQGSATTVAAKDALEGKIELINTASQTITVMGQRVQIEDNVTRLNDDDTVKTFSLAFFAVGDVVEVNGYPDETGDLRATRVAKKIFGEFETKGFVGSLNLGASTFNLSRNSGGAPFITVNYSPGQLPAGMANGSLVQVKAVAAPFSGIVTASLIQLADKLGASGEMAKAEGLVTSGTVADFVINGQQVISNAATVYEGGLGADFALGVKLEAEGPLNSSGAIIASKISFRSNIRIEADASAVSATSLSLLGKTVSINLLTRFDNVQPVDGSHLEVRAITDRNGDLLATRIKVLSPSTTAFLQGPVTAQNSAAGTLTILGSTLVSDGNSEWRVSSSASEPALVKAAFYAQLKTNISVVKVKWEPFTLMTAPIKQAEIELGK